jgi:hypothetical protein
MIWYLRVFGLVSLLFGGLVLFQGSVDFSKDWQTSLKADQAFRTLYQTYNPKSFKAPQIAEILTERRLGESVKIQILAWNPGETSSTQVEITGFSHYESIVESVRLVSQENGVQIFSHWKLTPKATFFSKVYVLFFAKSDLETLRKTLEISFPKPISPK